MRKFYKIIAKLLSIIAVLAIVYSVLVYSHIPFIEKWRTIYIETAMSTMTHQWLATRFIPNSVIQEVMAAKEEAIEAQKDLNSDWDGNHPEKTTLSDDLPGKEKFYYIFDEIDEESFEYYISCHPDVIDNGYENILIDESGLDAEGTSLRTKQGDQILTIDAANGILILKVTGEGYVGKLAIVKDPSQVSIGVSSRLGSTGESVADIAKNNDAVLAVNASGFDDPDGEGNGGVVDGLLISNHDVLNQTLNTSYLVIGLSDNDKLFIGSDLDMSLMRDAVQFSPAEIINGENVTDGSNGFGIQPRTSIGQASDGDILLLTVDGRQIGYSVGCTVGDCADILLRYDAVQAANLDGGSSTIMVYRGQEITKPANGYAFGRYVPDAFIVKHNNIMG
ncbi:MAG: phosphodiester glycosidase family protein [Oscillospiraceae bacterium]